MKKVILIIINLILVVMLTGCSTAESEPAGTNNTNDKTQLITENIPDYTDKIYVEINGNKAEFSDEDKKRTDAFELYTDLDELGRCGAAYANICKELMPTEKRGSIGMIKPSGWQLAKYDSVEDSGEGVEFNVFVYNVQPDITINYQDGTSSGSGQIVDGAVKDNETRNSEAVIGNKNTKVYHDNDCGSLPKEDNRIYFDSAGEAENAGYRAHACI